MSDLDHTQIAVVLQALDSELANQDLQMNIVIAGGAAIALRHSNRSTQDIDRISDEGSRPRCA